MRVRLDFLAFVVLGGLTLATTAHAQVLEKAVQSIAKDTCEVNQWPNPYLCPDRAAVRAPFEIMVQNGWRRQNLMGDHFFKEKTGALNEAGQQVVSSIAIDSVPQHRMIYVSRATTPDETAARIAAVQKQVEKFSPAGSVPVLATTMRPTGYPANWPNPEECVGQSQVPHCGTQQHLPAETDRPGELGDLRNRSSVRIAMRPNRWVLANPRVASRRKATATRGLVDFLALRLTETRQP